MIPIRDNLSFERTPFGVYGFMSVIVAVFVLELLLGPHRDAFILNFGMIPIEVVHNANLLGSNLVSPAISSLTSMFLHASFLHAAGNLIFLWVFGRGVEETLGHIRFAAFYVVSGYLGHFGHLIVDPESHIPLIGASGAIAGIMGAYMLLFPRARIRTVVPIFIYPLMMDLPAGFFLIYWFLIQTISGFGSLSGGGQGVAWFAHIAGFLFGVIYVRRFANKYPSRIRLKRRY